VLGRRRQDPDPAVQWPAGEQLTDTKVYPASNSAADMAALNEHLEELRSARFRRKATLEKMDAAVRERMERERARRQGALQKLPSVHGTVPAAKT
jgi:hypothetical protein